MTTITDFPADVQEILIFMRDNKFLSTIYKGSDKNTEIVTNINRALEIYTDQDIKKPYYFLQDIFSSAQKKITPPSTQLFGKICNTPRLGKLLRKNNK